MNLKGHGGIVERWRVSWLLSVVLGKMWISNATVVEYEKNAASYRLVQVHIVHRHGDRTPITPMANTEEWAELLPTPEKLEQLSKYTNIQKDPNFVHAAQGAGPFGKLTALGVEQMVGIGEKLRLEFPDLVPSDVEKIYSTDFPRTIQSLQALLSGLFPPSDSYENDNPVFDVDARQTRSMIPDPQPRNTAEQINLEEEMGRRPHVIKRNKELEVLAARVNAALAPLLGQDPSSASFGVGEYSSSSSVDNNDGPVLSWSQMKEIITCLKLRGKMPSSITEEDYEVISLHAAWTWFETLSNLRLSELAAGDFVRRILRSLRAATAEDSCQGGIEECDLGSTPQKSPSIHFHSCHDSSLIALICAFQLERPMQWPPYGSLLRINLFQNNITKKNLLQFSLNGQVLKSFWADADAEMDWIPLETLWDAINGSYEGGI